MTFHRSLGLGAGLLALLLAAAAQAQPDWARYLEESGANLHPPPHGPRSAQAMSQVIAADDPRLDYDVLHYDLSFEPLFETEELIGTTRVRLETSQPNINEIVLDLADEMVIQDAWMDSAGIVGDIPFEHAGDQVRLILPRAFHEDEILELGISYRGRPGSSFGHTFFGTHGSGPIAASLSEPASAHSWWACKDIWTDKATLTVQLTSPPGFTGVSNGNPGEQETGQSGETIAQWRTNYPIATYLVAIAVTDYVSWETTYVGEDGGEIPLVFYAYPDHEEEAKEAWTEPTRESMEVFEKLFGPYPFRRKTPEKYGTAEFHWTSGAEEHQTLCSFGSGFVDSTHGSDWVVAHELSHQWFGDAVTPDAFHETWTKEGVASYCEALYFEHRELLRGNTPEAARDALMNYMERMRWPERFDQDIMGNPQEPYDLVSVYHRGAWVLHMLRRIMGDDDFFVFMKSFMERHLYGNAGTEEMVLVAEETYLETLSWFFEPWVYTNARPHISYEWTSRSLGGDLWEVHLHVEQTQGADPFRLPVDLRISGSTEERWEEVWLEGRWQDFTFQTDFEPRSVEIDPDGWYLAEIGLLPQTASGVVLRTPAPNPVANGTDVAIRYRIPSSGEATLHLLDVAGRSIGNIDSGSRPEGWHFFRWDGLVNGGRLASGIYWLRLHHSGRTATEKVVILR